MPSTEPSQDHPTPSDLPESCPNFTEEVPDPTEGHLFIVQDDAGRRRFVLESEVYSIGRERTCDIRLFSQFVSRHHATLVRVVHEDGTDSYRIVDGSLDGQPSANGLLINGNKFKTYDLENEEEIVFGPQVRAVYYRVVRQGSQELSG